MRTSDIHAMRAGTTLRSPFREPLDDSLSNASKHQELELNTFRHGANG